MSNDCLLDHSLAMPFGLDLLSVHDFVKIILHVYVNNSSFVSVYVDSSVFQGTRGSWMNSYLKAEEKVISQHCFCR